MSHPNAVGKQDQHASFDAQGVWVLVSLDHSVLVTQ